ncbi:MAG TPA: thioredoxin domain-containing protein [Solirubrobacterales bacterium]|nr:thioredoxin domain-containing protein [Solirubrobacterales bacterium]
MSAWVPRVLLGIGIVALIAGLISIAVGEGGPGAPEAVGGVNDVQRIIGGIPQEEDTLGDEDAEVTVSVFNDIQCTDPCADFQINTVDRLIEDYARTDEAKLVFRHFAVSGHEISLAAIAAEAAGEQARQWQYIDTFVRNQEIVPASGVDEELLREVAESVANLELEEWEAAYDDPASEEAARADADLAADLQLPGEPAVVVEGPGGQETLIETPSYEEIAAAIEAVSG